MVRTFRSQVTCLAIALASASAVLAGPHTLFYHRYQGAQKSYRVEFTAQVPGQAEKSARYFIVEKVQTSLGDGFSVKTSMELAGHGVPSGSAFGTYWVGADGRISQMTGIDPVGTVPAADLRSVALLYVPLEEGPTSVGATWTAQRILYLPNIGLPGGARTVKLDTTCRLLAVQGPDDLPLAFIDVSAKESSGESIRADLKASYRFMLQDGHVQSGTVSGVLEAKTHSGWTRIPIRFSIGTATPSGR